MRAGLLSSILGAFSTAKTTEKEAEQVEAMSTNPPAYPVSKSEQEWQAILSPEQFRILRKQGTEAPGSGEYNKHYAPEGVYTCAGCSTPLYKARTKFKSGCGWPAFYENLPGKVLRREDRTHGVIRTEIVCASCGGHLGHVFKGEGYDTPTDERHCVNSVSLRFVDDESQTKA